MKEEKIKKSREEIYAEAFFEWVKTERQGEISKFRNFDVQNDVEYIVFQDNTRVRSDLIGDVVLAHQHESEIIGQENLQHSGLGISVVRTEPQVNMTSRFVDPVVSILEKTKKKTQKITITLTVKIPATELYSVIKDNFDNTDEILLQSVIDQIQDNVLREAIHKELQNIYQKKKKSNGATV